MTYNNAGGTWMEAEENTAQGFTLLLPHLFCHLISSRHIVGAVTYAAAAYVSPDMVLGNDKKCVVNQVYTKTELE